ncbi:MAG: RNA 2',3'-cyclic phosphodiesterase [Candidatus Hydrogenedentes bacterium]|nr:RNA 2',3'-cyclic phosphodiesterase [Candidatus Hydrogenedentota bacterium]
MGVRLAEELRAPFSMLCEELGRSPVRVKWVDAEKAHFTLRFLGEIDERETDSISESLEIAVSTISSFSVRVRGIGAFPRIHKPNVIWAGIHPSDGPVAELKTAVDAALAEHGFPRERRAFRPHFTLGRVKDRTVAGHLAKPLRKLADANIGTMEVRDVAFIRSTLRPQGPLYENLAVFRLGDQ